MKPIESFFDNNIKLDNIKDGDKIPELKENSYQPIIEFNNILLEVKRISEESKNNNDEISAMEIFKSRLENFAKKFQLSKQHFSIENSGDTIVVKNKDGQHYIEPTHFEKGAYFSSPHFDHQLNYSSQQIPEIHIGKYTRLGKGSAVNAGANIFIGDFVWLAPGSTLLRQEHNAYGQPSIGSRTVAMTSQPSIHLSDYSWIGRDVIVGWGAEYIGKCSIVGARSFINKWVGDYSIVGDHSKILGYLPFKAYFMEYYRPTLKDILKISDWGSIFDEWNLYYEENHLVINKSTFPDLTNDSDISRLFGHNNIRILIINPKTSNIFVDLPQNIRADIFLTNTVLTPFILQEAQNKKMKNIRLRQVEEISNLPLTANKIIMGKETGYDIVILDKDDFNNNKSLIISSLKTQGMLVFYDNNECSSKIINNSLFVFKKQELHEVE